MTTQLNITQDEYVRLRNQGLSKDQIIQQYSGQDKGPGQSVLDVASGVTNFLGGKQVAETFGSEIARLTAKTPDARANIEANYPGVRETIGSGLQLGANLLPVGRIASGLSTGVRAAGLTKGAGLLGKIGAGAATGATFDIGRNLQEGGQPGIGVGTVAGASLPVLGKIVGLTTGKGASMLSRKLEEVNLRLTPVEKQNLAKKGQDIASYLATKKVVGTPAQRYAQVNNLYNQMETKVSDIINRSGTNYQKTKLIQEIQDLPTAFQNDPELQSEARTIINALVKNLQSRQSSTISGDVVQQLKRNYFKRAFAKNATDVVSDTRLAIGGYFKKLLDDAIPQLKPLNREYGYLIASNRALQKAATRSEIGLVGKIAGGAAGAAVGGSLGGGIGAGIGAAVGPQFGKVVAGTLPRSAAGATLQGISRLSNQISKLPLDAGGNVPLKAVLDIIEKFRD